MAIKILKILAVLAILLSISIPFIAHSQAAQDLSNSVSVSCLVKGFSVNGPSLEVFVEINVYNSPKGIWPMKMIVENLTRSIHQYRKDHDLEEFDDDNTFVKIMSTDFH